MEFDHKIVDGVHVVNMDEAIDLYSTPMLKKFLRTLIKEENSKIVLALSKVNFIDSSGLGMLVNIEFECREKGAKLKLAEISSEAIKVISLAKNIDKFEILPTVTEAIQSFK